MADESNKCGNAFQREANTASGKRIASSHGAMRRQCITSYHKGACKKARGRFWNAVGKFVGAAATGGLSVAMNVKKNCSVPWPKDK